MKKTPVVAALVLLAALGGCALFRPNSLTLVVTPEGGGTVTVVPEQESYGNGQVVTITATPAEGFEFHAYLSGDKVLSELVHTVTLPMNGDIILEVSFWESVADSYSGDGDEAFLVDAASEYGMVYTLDVGSEARDVYMVFTNTGSSSQTMPTVMRRVGDFGATLAPRFPSYAPLASGPVAQRGSPITEVYAREGRERLEAARSGGAPRGITPPPAPLKDSVLDTHTFLYEPSTVGTIPATCRAVVTDGVMTVNVWVADDMWLTTVTQAMLNEFVPKFLAGGASDDIYDWVTDIYGPQWGAYDASYDGVLIPDTATEITILLYDIDGDAATFQTEGGVVGFFWAKDNFLNGAGLDYSNERVMFYMDAPMLAAKDGPTWDITDWWPEEVVSTLAHEFQHMIRFYQKDVLRPGTGDETWLNEMSSMVTEDFISDKLEVPGPRGVDPVVYNDGSAGLPGTPGFLALYNSQNWEPVAEWNPTLESYAVNYAFGAYLARNFGGATLFRDIQHTSDTGRDSVDAAFTTGDVSETFVSALRKWTVAVLLSDNVGLAPPYRYNMGAWLVTSVDTADYNLGSINLFNYQDGNQVGPFVWTALPDQADMPATSSYYYLAASGGSGELVWAVGLAPDVQVQVVVKE